jgi:thiol-disulfide isomerase/thioredoxin
MTEPRRMRHALLALAILVVACTEQAPDQAAPQFPEGSGQPAAPPPAYPEGPYGIGVGSTLRNLRLEGFAAPMTASTALQDLSLADFYNPSGTDTFPAGSPYGAGTAKPKALLVDLCAMWCAPCRQEAQMLLPPRRAMYAPAGEILLALLDGTNPGVAASTNQLTSWVHQFQVDYPTVLDPAGLFSAYFATQAFPSAIVVRTRDMKIVFAHVGIVDDALWTVFEKVLHDEPVLPGD